MSVPELEEGVFGGSIGTFCVGVVFCGVGGVLEERGGLSVPGDSAPGLWV